MNDNENKESSNVSFPLINDSTELLRINSSGIIEYYKEGYWQVSWKTTDER